MYGLDNDIFKHFRPLGFRDDLVDSVPAVWTMGMQVRRPIGNIGSPYLGTVFGWQTRECGVQSMDFGY